MANVNALLNSGSYYLSICFSEKDPQFGGEGKFRKTSIGTELYFSSEEELRVLFEPYFAIEELENNRNPRKRIPASCELCLDGEKMKK